LSRNPTDQPRRSFLRLAALFGAGGAVFGRALLALADGKPQVTAEMVKQAEWVAGLQLNDAERGMMLEELAEAGGGYAALRAIAIDNAVAPALVFAPASPVAPPAPTPASRAAYSPPRPADRPASDEDLSYAGLRVLSDLLRRGKLSPVELAKVSLERMKRLDPGLFAVVNATPSIALPQAEAAGKAIAEGRWKGPLHGVPWGAKDLVAVPGAPTTWGSRIYEKQVRPETATVAARLAEAGAVLTAKTAVGELAMGDVWFGGMTRNPWKPAEGSSGSSAGSAAGVAAGYFPFAIGTETWGSIVSPSTRCGVTGLRPTFGRVPRHGVMALAWSMDKVGVIARSAEDCALAFAAIHGADPLDPAAVTRPFVWPAARALTDLRVGVPKALFELPAADPDDPNPAAKARGEQQKGLDAAVLEVLRALGVKLVPFELPGEIPVPPLAAILTAEAAAAFDGLVRSGRVKDMVRQTKDAWPNYFRLGQLVPAVEYLRANRLRTLLLRHTEEKLREVDLFVAPTFAGDALLLTNLTGHPAVVVPNGFRQDGTPGSITFTGRLHGEADILQVAHAYQEATAFHRRRPPLA
jgi:Asp-tRNA(Asn)/Glu-tRNA(Gln) amidotransferase A subunit family amidase